MPQPASSAIARRLSVLTLAGALALAGCAGPGTAAPPEEPRPTLPDGVAVELAQLRADVASRQAQVRVTNGSDTAIAVGEVGVEDARFDGTAMRVIADRVSTIPAGGAVDIRIQLPPVDCTAPDEGDAEVVLEIVSDSGTAEVKADAPDPLGFIPALHARECLLEHVAEAASLAFTGFRPSPPGEPAGIQLTVTPTGEGAVTVVGIERTNLLDFAGVPADEDMYPLGIEVSGAAADAAVVEVPLLPFRCDPHAVQEDKRGTIFDVRVELDGEPGEVELFVGEELRGRILSWVASWCGFGG